MKCIPLTRGMETIVDDEDFAELSKFNWHAKVGHNTDVYATRTIWIGGQKDGKSHKILMHKVLCPCPKGMVVDHINGNSLDNRKSNLRLSTIYQNWYNRKKPCNNLSGYLGVSRRRGKWLAQIVHNKRYYKLGLYDTPAQASAVYQEKAKELRAEFARSEV